MHVVSMTIRNISAKCIKKESSFILNSILKEKLKWNSNRLKFTPVKIKRVTTVCGLAQTKSFRNL